MSYDIYAVCQCCPSHADRQLFSWGSCTSNLAPMWCAAGADLADFHGKTPAECAAVLGPAIDVLKSDPERFRAMNPPNGWGRYDDAGEGDPGLVTVLERLLKQLHAAALCPTARVRVWR